MLIPVFGRPKTPETAGPIKYLAWIDPGVMGPFGMPGASNPGPPGPKVCILRNIFFFYWNLWQLEGEKFMIPVSEPEF